MKNILVTGGAGFIGSHTCKALARAGFLPIALDNLSRGHASAVKYGPLEVGNIGDAESLTRTIRRYRPEAIIHFAGFGYVGESMESPELYYENNVACTARMLEALRHCGLRNIVFSSSCATYGGHHDRPIDESVEQRPISTYGFTKLAIERMLTDYGHAHGFRSLALRYFNAAGADPDGELGECHEPEPHFIPSVLRVAAGRESSIALFGNDYPTPDGTCVRDYTHVHDLAEGHVRALQAVLEGGLTGALNFGTGRGTSLMDIVRLAKAVTGQEIPATISPRRAGDPAYAVADTRRAEQILRWKPMFVDMHETISHAWQWMKRPPAQQSVTSHGLRI